LLRTTVIGDRRGVPPPIEEGFKVAGATHVLSVSGLHLAAVAALLFLGARAAATRIPRLPLYVDPRAIAAVVVFPAVTFYALVTRVALAVVPLGLAGAIAGALWPPLGGLPLTAAGWAARAALAIAGAFRASDALLTCRIPTWLETAALTAAGGWALAAVIRR